MAASYVASAEEDLTCPLCLELFVDPDHTPKDLTCPHVYCYTCLVKMVEGGRPTISCPECRAVTKVPPNTRTKKGGVAALKTNLRIRSLAEKHLKHTEKHNSGWTDEQFGDAPSCPKHDAQKMYFYCVTCEVMACQACLLLVHEGLGHGVKSVEVVYKEKVSNLDDNVGKLEQEVELCKLQAIESAKLEKKIHSDTKAVKSDIDKAVDLAIASVKKQGKALKDELTRMNKQQLTKFQRQTKDLNAKVCAARAMISDAKKVKEKSTSYEYVQYVKRHESLVKQLKEKRFLLWKRQKNHNLKSFKLVKETIPKLGKIVPVRKLKLMDDLGPWGEDVGVINGMATGPGTLAVCVDDEVDIYSKHEDTGLYEKCSSLNLTRDLTEDTDNLDVDGVAVTGNGKYLVARNQNVEMYDNSGEFDVAIHTIQDKTTSDLTLLSVATTPDDKIVVGDHGGSELTVYLPNGDMVNSIKTSIQPCCIASMNNTQVAVSNDTSGKVCILDLDSGKETLDIDIPGAYSICYDKETGCLLVGRTIENRDKNKSKSGVIEQHCLTTGRLVACIHAEPGLECPEALAITDDGLLAVADDKSFLLYEMI